MEKTQKVTVISRDGGCYVKLAGSSGAQVIIENDGDENMSIQSLGDDKTGLFFWKDVLACVAQAAALIHKHNKSSGGGDESREFTTTFNFTSEVDE